MENRGILEIVEHAIEAGLASGSEASGLPLIDDNHFLSDDIVEFYNNYGSLTFFEHSSFPIKILSPREFRLANPEMFRGVSSDEISKTLGDRSWAWYFLAESVGDTEEKVVLDLSRDNNGKCYDCYWVTYPGDSNLIARSFTDFILQLVKYEGDFIPWK